MPGEPDGRRSCRRGRGGAKVVGTDRRRGPKVVEIRDAFPVPDVSEVIALDRRAQGLLKRSRYDQETCGCDDPSEAIVGCAANERPEAL